MQETVTPEMIRGVYARVKEPKALLLTLMAEGIDNLYLTNYPEGMVSRGQTYEYFPFGFKWPGSSQEDVIRNARVEIASRDERLMYAIRQATGVPKMTLELVRVAAPDVVEMTLKNAELADAEVDSPSVVGNLQPKTFKTEPACLARYIISRTPGLF